jgi:hypothetical protein
MYTKSPHGHHRVFRIKSEDFPDGIKSDKYLTIGNDHSEIAVIGKEHILRERSPEHKVINGVECLVTLEKAEVDELFKALNKLKESDAAMKVADLLLPYYYQPHRDDIIFSLSGFLHKNKTPQYITEKIVLHIIKLTNYPDEDSNKALRTIQTGHCSALFAITAVSNATLFICVNEGNSNPSTITIFLSFLNRIV